VEAPTHLLPRADLGDLGRHCNEQRGGGELLVAAPRQNQHDGGEVAGGPSRLASQRPQRAGQHPPGCPSGAVEGVEHPAELARLAASLGCGQRGEDFAGGVADALLSARLAGPSGLRSSSQLEPRAPWWVRRRDCAGRGLKTLSAVKVLRAEAVAEAGGAVWRGDVSELHSFSSRAFRSSAVSSGVSLTTVSRLRCSSRTSS
jgi:hypothetical protein